MTPLDFFHLEGTSKIPTIYRHTDEQLETAIAGAIRQYPDFYMLLHGIDAYMEQQRRRMRKAKERCAHVNLREQLEQSANLSLAEFDEHMWGQS